MYEILPNPFYADFIFSCPPYFNLEVYSNSKEDLSNMTWDSFKREYEGIVYRAIQMLKPNRFGCFVVSEVRDSNGKYVGLVPETITAFEKAKMIFYNEIILVNSVGSLPIRINKMFGYYRKIGRTHQNILVFYKGDVKEIQNNYNYINVSNNIF